MNTIRAFIAAEISEEARSKLEQVQAELRRARSDVRWESTSKMHITLKFLGDTSPDLLPRIIGQLEDIGRHAGTCGLILKGIGAFPAIHRPRVIWAGCENPDGNLKGIRASLESSLFAEGFERERNPFHPHITLGRCRDGNAPRELISLLETVTFDPVSFIINQIVLMKSTLKPGGSEYSILQSIHLAG
jgi:RNA 2',3'-cyclic 3'-phosphodiesterase